MRKKEENKGNDGQEREREEKEGWIDGIFVK